MNDEARKSDEDDLKGGQGPDEVAKPNTRDARLLERAVKQRWPLSESAKARAVEVVTEIIDDPDSSERAKIASVRAMATMESQNMEQEKRDEGLPEHVVVHHKKAAAELSTEELRLVTKLRRRAEQLANDSRSE